MRLAIYSDFPYRRDAQGLTAEQPVALFYAAMAAELDRLVLVGRLDPVPGRYPHALPESVELRALPHYATLSLRALGGLRPAVRAFRHAIEDVDAVWLLGPHPLAIAFALVARARGRRVALGVRQHLPDYLRHRHPGRPAALAAGWALELAWRTLALAFPTVAVGAAEARRYRHSRRVLEATISLVAAREVERDVPRDYSGPKAALSVGRLDPEKNPLLLADVLAALPDDWRLEVCGEGSERAALAARLDRLGVAGRARLHGHVPPGEELGELYRSSHALLHVSWTEGMPQVLLEAWAARLPVVATAVGGVPGLAEGAAELVAPGDAAAPAAALTRLADDEELRRRLVEAGTERVLARTREAQAAAVVGFLEGAA